MDKTSFVRPSLVTCLFPLVSLLIPKSILPVLHTINDVQSLSSRSSKDSELENSFLEDYCG